MANIGKIFKVKAAFGERAQKKIKIEPISPSPKYTKLAESESSIALKEIIGVSYEQDSLYIENNEIETVDLENSDIPTGEDDDMNQELEDDQWNGTENSVDKSDLQEDDDFITQMSDDLDYPTQMQNNDVLEEANTIRNDILISPDIEGLQKLVILFFEKLDKGVTLNTAQLDQLLKQGTDQESQLKILKEQATGQSSLLDALIKEVLTLKKQNAKLQVMLNRTGAGTSSNSEGVPKLPINSTEQLRDADTKLKEAFIRGIFVQDLKVLKGHDGPEKTLARVFSDQLLATYNWDGRKGHSALKAFETVVDSIFAMVSKPMDLGGNPSKLPFAV